MNDPEIAPGFQRVSGTQGPRDGKWFIQLRGTDKPILDDRNAYSPSQIIWRHNGGAGDVIAVKRIE